MKEAQPSTSEAETPHVKTILIVEDDDAIGNILVQAIKDETTYQVTLVQGGFTALKVVRTLIPNLILLDYFLPGIDGLECVELLRATPGVEHTPIILMSANLPERAKERTDLLVMNKPFELDFLLSQVVQILETEATTFSDAQIYQVL
jgi:CheY-like chemotaxis protein